MKFFKRMTIGMVALLLGGCINSSPKEEGEPQQTNKSVPVQTTSAQLSDEYYRAIIVDGKYKLGASASGDQHMEPSNNMREFENGLLRISKQFFPTNQYYLQEGQVIDSQTLTNWVSRESEENPEGLNPSRPDAPAESTANQAVEQSPDESNIESSSTEESSSQPGESTNTSQVQQESVAPIYLGQIMEKDLMVESNGRFELSGIVIGLAMNSHYDYTDADGVTHTQEISVGEMRERGRQFANMIVGRLRNTEELRSIPIVVGIYSMPPKDAIISGSYVLDGISREGNSISEWHEHNEYHVALPVRDNSTQEDFLFFDNFKNDIQNFFPNLNGISADALFIEGKLAQLDINIVSQFYQKTEIVALTQYVNDVAHRQLPENIPVHITIDSAAGPEAYVTRSSGSGQFNTLIVK